MKIFLIVTLALQLACVEIEAQRDKCGPCQCYIELNNYNTIWPWPNKKVAQCHELPDPDDILPDREVLYIVWAKNLTTLKEDEFISNSYKKLESIYIHEGTLKQIHKHTFRNVSPTVTKINLWDNLLTEIPTGAFSYASNVVMIVISKNKLRVLQTKLFSNLKFLKTIELADNEISLIEENCFVNLPSLEEIRLFDNKLHTLSVNIMDNISNLRYLSLHGNPWNCNDTLCKLMDFVNKRQLWGDRPVPTCTTPGNIRGKNWNKIQQDMLFSFTPNFMRVFEKDSFTLKCKHCFASQLRWTFDGRQLPINYQQISEDSLTSKLTIENVHKNQQGEYRCYVKNCKDCDVAGLYLEVKEERHQKFDWNAVLQKLKYNKMSQEFRILLPNMEENQENYMNNEVWQT